MPAWVSSPCIADINDELPSPGAPVTPVTCVPALVRDMLVAADVGNEAVCSGWVGAPTPTGALAFEADAGKLASEDDSEAAVLSEIVCVSCSVTADQGSFGSPPLPNSSPWMRLTRLPA